MRLINADEAIRLVNEEFNEVCVYDVTPSQAIDDFESIINRTPTIESQTVIRCKDCNEWHSGINLDGSDIYSDEGYCCVHRIITGENYYCGDAERR